MAKRYNLTGVGSNVELSKDGPRVKNNAGVVELRNQADDAFAVTRVANGVNANDAVNKSQLDALDVGSSMRFRKVDFAYDTASPFNIGSQIPAGGTVIGFMVNVTTPFDGATPTLEMGDSGDTDGIAQNAQVDLTEANLDVGDALVTYGSATQVIGTLSAAGATQGAATALIKYIP